MQRETIKQDLAALAFDFFYLFSRFEFALKENGYLKNRHSGANAEASWEQFVDSWNEPPPPVAASRYLLEHPPKKQVVNHDSSLSWKDVNLDDCRSELARIARLVKTVRNNLFHGGKHGAEGWDDLHRLHQLLYASVAALNQMAEVGEIEADYRCRY